MKKYANEQLLILETGRMGEPIKALQKMANGTHRTLRIQEGISFILRRRLRQLWKRSLPKRKISFTERVEP